MLQSIKQLWLRLTGGSPKGRRPPGRYYTCVGGPWDGKDIWLDSPVTLTFALHGQRGFYHGFDDGTRFIYWEEVK